jgi:hypothetical protein
MPTGKYIGAVSHASQFLPRCYETKMQKKKRKKKEKKEKGKEKRGTSRRYCF